MPITTLRTLFKTTTGREDMADADIDKYINEGVKLLDMLSNFSKSPARYFTEISLGAYNVDFSSKCRVLKEVWIFEAGIGRTKLEKVDRVDLLSYYTLPSGVGKEKPKYYSPRIIRAHPDDFDPTDPPYNGYTEFIDTVVAYQNTEGITIMPPADKSYMIEVNGLFYSPELSGTVTDNWWSVNHERAVVDAGAYQYFSSLGNTEGMKDYLGRLVPVTTSIDHDAAEVEAIDVTRLEG